MLNLRSLVSKSLEQFYSFIQSKWKSESCSKDCDSLGRSAGEEYANRMRIQLDNEVQ